MLKIYSTGCIGCLAVVKKMLLKKIEFSVIDNPETVSEVASRTLGFVPVFDYNGKIYNQVEIGNMVDLGCRFTDEVVPIKLIKDNVVIPKEEVKIINTKTKEV